MIQFILRVFHYNLSFPGPAMQMHRKKNQLALVLKQFSSIASPCFVAFPTLPPLSTRSFSLSPLMVVVVVVVIVALF